MARFPRHLKIATLFPSDETVFDEAADGTLVYDLESGLMFFLSQFLNFTYTLVAPKDGSSSQPLGNATWNGLLEEEADISFTLLSVYEEKTKAVDFSCPFYTNRDFTFMTQKPQPLQKSLNIFNPFSGTIWATLMLFILGFSLLFSAMKRRERSYSSTFFSILDTEVGQSLNLRLISSIKHGFFFVGWIVGISFLIRCCSSTFFPFSLVVPTKGITSIPELAVAVTEHSVKCKSFKGNYIFNALMESENESHKIIGKSLNENSQDHDYSEYFNPNSGETTAFIASVDSFRCLQNKFLTSKDSLLSEKFAFPMTKKFCCKKKINKIIRGIAKGGLFKKIFNDTQFRLDIIDEALNPSFATSFSYQPLSLNSLGTAFALLVCGYIAAILVLIGENLYYYHKMSQRSPQTLELETLKEENSEEERSELSD